MKFPSSFLSLFLSGASVALALDKPAIAPEKAPAAHASSDEAGIRNAAAAAEIAAAIEALGAQPSTRQISGIVFTAVRTSPAGVLPIVHAAVSVSPQAAAPGIVTAATAAVPNPWKPVIYRRITGLNGKQPGPDFTGGPDGARTVEPDDRGPSASRGESNVPANTTGRTAADISAPDENKPDVTITLAEAIVRTAFDAQPGLSLPKIMAAADVALLADPATLLRNIQSPRSISGVGDAGSSNYANEPLRIRVAAGTPVPTPNAPVVSR